MPATEQRRRARTTRGERRHLVTLDTLGTPVGDGEGYSQTPTALSPATVYVRIDPASAQNMERIFGNTVQVTASHLVTMDYHSGVNTKTRITFGSRVFNVTGVHNPEEQNIDLILAVTEVVP